VQHLKEVPNTSVYETWMYSEDGWSLLAQIIQTVGAIAETAALVYMLHRHRKEKRKSENPPMQFIVTASKSAIWDHICQIIGLSLKVGMVGILL